MDPSKMNKQTSDKILNLRSQQGYTKQIIEDLRRLGIKGENCQDRNLLGERLSYMKVLVEEESAGYKTGQKRGSAALCRKYGGRGWKDKDIGATCGWLFDLSSENDTNIE